MHAAIKTGEKSSFSNRLGRDMRRYWRVYLMLLPVVAFYLIFKYGSMGYLVIAFQNFKPAKGILGSRWVGLENFVKFFNNSYCWRLIRNTLLLNVFGILFSFPAPILLALMINEVKRAPFKKAVQTVSYMPHFISLIVMCGLISDFSSSMGLFNAIGSLFGAPVTNYLSSTAHYRTLYVGSGVWKSMGWSSIIYLATLSAIDPSLYEAAAIDGAGRFRRIWHVTLPALVPIIVVQLIMRMGSMMSEGSEKTILLYNESTFEVSDIVSSFVYRRGLLQTNYSYGAAVGLFNSLVNIVLLSSTNFISRHLTNESLW